MSWFKNAIKSVSDFAVKGLKTSARVITTGGSAVGGFVLGGPAGAAAAGSTVNKLWSGTKDKVKGIASQALTSASQANMTGELQAHIAAQDPRFDLNDYIKFPEIKTQVTAKADNDSLMKFGILGAALIGAAMFLKK